MKVYAYFYKSESGDNFLEIEKSEKKLTVYEAMEHFEWEYLPDWEVESYEDIPYTDFIVESIDI